VRKILHLEEGVCTIQVEAVPCTILNMDFFDVFQKEGLTSVDGILKPCMIEHYAGIEVDNVLLDAMVNPESEYASSLSEAQRSEFIFRLFQVIFIGGAMHQRNDNCRDYLETTRKIYKELLTVHRNARTSAIEISSHVYEIRVHDEETTSVQLFPQKSEYNRCFMIVDRAKRYVTVIYAPHKQFW